MSTFMSKLERGLISKEPEEKDYDEIVRLYLRDPSYDLTFGGLAERIVKKEEKLLGYGIVKRFAEAVLVLDKDKTQREKVGTLISLLKAAIRECQIARIDDLHVFSTDPQFSKLLINQFGFQRVKGDALVFDLRNENGKE